MASPLEIRNLEMNYTNANTQAFHIQVLCGSQILSKGQYYLYVVEWGGREFRKWWLV